jgi:hypothetical protein
MSSLLLYADICWKITSLAIIFNQAFSCICKYSPYVTRMPFLPCAIFFMNPDGTQDVMDMNIVIIQNEKEKEKQWTCTNI